MEKLEKQHKKNLAMIAKFKLEDYTKPEKTFAELLAENRILKDKSLCLICKDKNSNRLFLPCAHLCTCDLCAPSLIACPQCKTKIHGIVSVYFA